MKAASSFALWEISGNQEGRTTTPPTDSPPSYEATVRVDSESQLMISYQWESKDTVLAIKERLTRTGLNVWLDEEEMST